MHWDNVVSMTSRILIYWLLQLIPQGSLRKWYGGTA